MPRLGRCGGPDANRDALRPRRAAAGARAAVEMTGVLMSVARGGGVARPLLPSQVGRRIPVFLLDAAARPDGELAFARFRPLLRERVCEVPFIDCEVFSQPIATPNL